MLLAVKAESQGPGLPPVPEIRLLEKLWGWREGVGWGELCGQPRKRDSRLEWVWDVPRPWGDRALGWLGQFQLSDLPWGVKECGATSPEDEAGSGLLRWSHMSQVG